MTFSADTIRTLVESGKQHRPDLSARLERAANIVMFRQMRRLGAQSWLVESNTTPGRFYSANGTCQCVDYVRGKAPGGWCLHRLAMALAEVAEEHEREAIRVAVETEWMAAARVRGY